MEILKNTFLLLLATFSIQIADAQKLLTDGTLTYAISVQSTDGKTEIATSLEGAVLTVYVKGMQSRTEMVSSLGTESTIYDGRTGKGAILKAYSGQKLMITVDAANWKQKNNFYQSVNFKIDNFKQTIGTYVTKKATALLPDGKSFTVNFTEEINTANKSYNNAFTQLPGLPVQYEIISGNLKFTYTLIKVEQDIVPSSKFDLPKSGYRIMTYDANQQLKKGDNK